MGADGVVIADREDKVVESTIRDVTERFGGPFSVRSGVSWRKAVRDWKSIGGKIVHLTAYGVPLPRVLPDIQGMTYDMMVVVGSEKMPGEMFRLADWNVSVTNQPMSEVAALAIFLDWYRNHSFLDHEFSEAQVRIIPSEHEKKIEQISR